MHSSNSMDFPETDFEVLNSSGGDKVRSVFFILLLHNFPTERNKVGKKNT